MTHKELTERLQDSIQLEGIRNLMRRVQNGEQIPFDYLDEKRAEFNRLMKKYFPDRKYLQVEKKVEEPEFMFV